MGHTSMKREEAEAFFSELYGGAHHIPNAGIKSHGAGWCVNHSGDLSTYDGNTLTRLVFMAHQKCIRVEIQPSGPGMVKIAIHKRVSRDPHSELWEYHPTIENALKRFRKLGINHGRPGNSLEPLPEDE